MKRLRTWMFFWFYPLRDFLVMCEEMKHEVFREEIEKKR